MKTPILAAALFALAVPATAQETRDFTDSAGRTVEIPAAPKRIVSTNDWFLTTPLIELEASVVGSVGSLRADDEIYIRGADILFGANFENTDIAFVGPDGGVDAESVAVLKPDLIIADTGQRREVERLEAIAPVVFLELNRAAIEVYRDVADVAGELPQFEERNAQFRRLLADGRTWIGDQEYTYSLMQTTHDGRELIVWAEYGMKSYLLDELGLTVGGESGRLREKGIYRLDTSFEALPENDADFVFGNYRVDNGADGGPLNEIAAFEAGLPGFCDFLTACREGRMVLVPRDYAVAPSFWGFTLLTHILVNDIAGRPGVTVPE